MKIRDWVYTDKFLHLETSLLIVLVLALYLPLWLSIICAIMVGVAKELWDSKHDGVASWLDIFYDVIGITLGVALYLVKMLL